MLDRWQAWFVHCDTKAEFPQWMKTCRPQETRQAGSDAIVGPMRDKHAAQKYIELLQDTFDLCRYHHILVQAPRGTACAYKEMGRCPSPCDGSIRMDAYHETIRESARVACAGKQEWLDLIRTRMEHAAGSQAYAAAARWKTLLGQVRRAASHQFPHAEAVDRLRLIVVDRGVGEQRVRVLGIRGGWIERLVDLDAQATEAEREAACEAINHRMAALPMDWSAHAVENLGLVSQWLHRPAPLGAGFLDGNQPLDSRSLARAIDHAMRRSGTDITHDDEEGERSMEMLPNGPADSLA